MQRRPGAVRSCAMLFSMDASASADAPAAPLLRDRTDIPARFKWNLTHIFAGWQEWQAAYRELETSIAAYATLQGTLVEERRRPPGGDAAARRYRSARLQGRVLRLAVYDEDQRDNADQRETPAGPDPLRQGQRRRRAWFDPGTAQDPARRQVQEWMAASPALAVYRFALEDLYRQQEHVLDDKGERLLSLASRFGSRRTTPTRRCPPPTSSIRPSRLSNGAGGHAHLRPVPRDPVDQPQSGRPCGRVPRVPPALRIERQHLRLALQRRAPARLVRRTGARLPRQRSTWRCTATTFRPRSSRT